MTLDILSVSGVALLNAPKLLSTFCYNFTLHSRIAKQSAAIKILGSSAFQSRFAAVLCNCCIF